MGRMNVIDWKFDMNNRYNIWSGVVGGFFLQLSYFGTDQSQVGRYLTGSSIGQSRLGLIMNGLVKIPMQFLILLIGVLVFVFYQFNQPPVFFNNYQVDQVKQSPYAASFKQVEQQYSVAFQQKKVKAENLMAALNTHDERKIDMAQGDLKAADQQTNSIRQEAIAIMKKSDPKTDPNDTNYVFLTFVTHYLPKGLIGLLIAIIFLASMGSMASALNSLASTTVVDIYKRMINPNASEKNYMLASRGATVLWGLVCIGMALYASHLGNLLEAVNQLGSYIYGTILGVFVVAFYVKRVKGNAVFISAIVVEACIVWLFWKSSIGFLWLNAIGALGVVALSVGLQIMLPKKPSIL